MKFRTVCWLALALSAGFLAYILTTQAFHRGISSVLKLDLLIDYPANMDLGEHERGELVVSPVTIANRGGGVLVIDQIETNCSCTGLEREEGGQYERIESLSL